MERKIEIFFVPAILKYKSLQEDAQEMQVGPEEQRVYLVLQFQRLSRGGEEQKSIKFRLQNLYQ